MIDEVAGLRVVEVEGTGVGELGESGLIGGGAGEQFRIGDGGGDHLAAFLGFADGEDLHARAGGFKHAEVLIDVFGVGKHVRRAGNIAEELGGGGDGF